MPYQLLIGETIYINGDIMNIIPIISIILLTIIFLFIFIWHRLRENNHLKYEFITIVAHKFRTPLTYIKWVCDSLIPEETDSFKKKSLDDIKKSNQKIIDLTSTLIEIADSENSNGVTYVYEKITVCPFIKEVADRFKDTLHEKNLFFSLNCENDNVKIKADRSRLEFVLVTLLENACTYTPIGKNVAVVVKNNFFNVKISVQDDGIGISKKDLPHIFSKFYRGSNARSTDTEGFGVGLYLASSIVKKMGGKITVYSAGKDLGSNFTVTLPRSR